MNHSGIATTLHVTEEGEGTPVLFCHGFPDTARTWQRQTAAVAATGYRAFALDMRRQFASHPPSSSGRRMA